MAENKKIGIIGQTGRMGVLLRNEVDKSKNFVCGMGFDGSSRCKLSDMFNKNDYVVDFSTHLLTKQILQIAIKNPRPLIICTTGWSELDYLIEDLSTIVPVIIAPNTSIGSYLQKMLSVKLADILSQEYDVDIIEKHHKNKRDKPSGTALSIANSIEQHFVNISSIRAGNIQGEHEISFTNIDESISIKHEVFDRSVFAKGALRIIEWLYEDKPSAGIYYMEDILVSQK